MDWSFLKSRAFWVIVVTFLVNGTNAVVPFLPASYQIGVNGILGILTMYFHVNPSQEYNQGQIKK